MKIIFAGTPHFSTNSLLRLSQEHRVVAVLTQPDRPGGRGMKLTASPVKELAMSLNLPIFQPHTLKDAEFQETMKQWTADVMVVAAYGLLLPPEVLRIPRLGCFNIHASLLPRWRGAAPIQRAILAGDKETGITIMQMDEGLDTGDILLTARRPIAEKETAQSLHDKLADLGAESISNALLRLQQGRLLAEKQQPALASYANKLRKEEAALDWMQSALNLERAVRAYYPSPGAYTSMRDTRIKILAADLKESNVRQESPGTITEIDGENIWVACANGILGLTMLQKSGGKALPSQQFLQGFPINVGDRFDLPDHAASPT